jgi:hypothetical protein
MFNVSFSIHEFLSLSLDSFCGKLTERHSFNHSELASNQMIAWKKEHTDLQKVLQGKKGRIIFEYSIPSLPKAIDVVILIEGKIFVVEYKANASSYNQQDIHQTNGYALRLKFFHSKSNDNWIIPILVATDAIEHNNTYCSSEEDMVFSTLLCNSNNLSTVIEYVLSTVLYDGSDEWENNWENGIFKASPTIIDAARNVWRQNNVKGFTMGESSAETRLKAEDYIVNTVVEETRNRPDGKNKSICFVTGVPGAGKTLVGLDISVKLQGIGASMLSGNGPLVEVLTTALKRDLKKNKKNLAKPKDEISVETIIRDAYGYKKEIFEKRLDYTVGSGTVKLKENAEKGSQHVIIFDEAQRAWNKEKMIRPGQNGRKYWQEDAFPFSEPALLLWDMNQIDWGVFVCLVGGGQEINTGEAGICEWLRAIKSIKDFDGWHIYMSDELRGSEYDSKSEDGMTLDSYRDYFKQLGRITVDSSLHLTACQRSNRTEKVALFVQELLDCHITAAKDLYCQIKDKYQIYLTRDVEVARTKLRERKRQLLDRGYIDGTENEECKIGMLMSSKAARLRPVGYEVKKVTEYLNKVPNWFLDPSDYVGSSDFLEIALNEFFVQGLELDVTAVMWDADFRYNKEKNDWDYYDFNGRVWSQVNQDSKTQEIKRFYMKNAYRVLLTRARAGMVIVIPSGSNMKDDNTPIDPTRTPSFYDCTYNYLKEIGIKQI